MPHEQNQEEKIERLKVIAFSGQLKPGMVIEDRGLGGLGTLRICSIV